MRFRLRSLMILAMLIAFYLGLYVLRPERIGIAALITLTFVSFPVCVGGIIYSKGSWRAFWIGFAVGSAPILYYLMTFSFIVFSNGESMLDLDDGRGMVKWSLAKMHALAAVNGLIVVAVRMFCLWGVETPRPTDV